jgi:hypothetical protein
MDTTSIKFNNNAYESMGDEFPADPQIPGEEDEDQDQVVNFASFLQESQELLELLKALQNISVAQLSEKSKRIVDIVSKSNYLFIFKIRSKLHFFQVIQKLLNTRI